METIIQDTLEVGDTFDFEGSPLPGTNRLVSSFTPIKTSANIIQDSYTADVPNIIQDVLG